METIFPFYERSLSDLVSRAERVVKQMKSRGTHSMTIPFEGRDVIKCKGGPKYEYPVGKLLDLYADRKYVKLSYPRYDGKMEVRDGVTLFDGGSPYYNPNLESRVIVELPITVSGFDILLELAFARSITQVVGATVLDYTNLALKNLNDVLSRAEETIGRHSKT